MYGAALRLEEKRNGSNVRERFHGVLFARAPSHAAGALYAGHRLHALHLPLAKKIIDPGRSRSVFSRHSPMDTSRVPYSPVHISLSTEDPFWKTPALHYSRCSSRLSKRCSTARHAAKHKHSACVFFLWAFLPNFRTPGTDRVCRIGFRLCLLRHAPLCDAPFPHEARTMALVETVPSGGDGT